MSSSEKPFSFQTLGKIQQGMQLSQAGLQRYAPSGQSLNVPAALPAVIASDGSNPVRFGGTATVRYVRINNILFFQFSFSLAAMTAPQGNIILRLPCEAPPALSGGSVHCGTWMASEGSGTLNRMDGWIETLLSTPTDTYVSVRLGYTTAATPAVPSFFGYNAPWVQGSSNNFISGSGQIIIYDSFTTST